MSTALEHIAELLKGANLKVTQQRLVIYQVLLSSKDHPSAEALFDLVKPTNPSISLATVYKTLDTFVEHGLVLKVQTSNGKMRYDARMDDHHHIHVNNTGEILDFHDEELDELIKSYLAKKNITNLDIKDISVHISGEKKQLNKKVFIDQS